MTVVRDAGFSWKQRGNVGSGGPRGGGGGGGGIGDQDPPLPPPPPFQTLFNRCTNKYQESNEICSLVLTYDDKQKIILIEFV